MRAPDKLISRLAGQIGGDGDGINDTEYGNGFRAPLWTNQTLGRGKDHSKLIEKRWISMASQMQLRQQGNGKEGHFGRRTNEEYSQGRIPFYCLGRWHRFSHRWH